MNSTPKPILLGCQDIVLHEAEFEFFSKENPLGFILFSRNIRTVQQLTLLCDYLKKSVGREDVPIFIDQEGGRVARLTTPQWPVMPSQASLGKLYHKNEEEGLKAMRLHASITATMLGAVGISGNFTPVVDLFVPGTSSVMGDRTFSSDSKAVTALGKCAVETYLAHGIMPCIKHMPGHGRVKLDPHKELPYVEASREELEENDFVPFKALASIAPCAMNCHVVFRALDPDNMVSMSAKVHKEILRGALGFEGIIFSDDLAMGALFQPLEERAVCAIEAGADIALYCTGELEESRKVCHSLAPMDDVMWEKWQKARSRVGTGRMEGDIRMHYAALNDLVYA